MADSLPDFEGSRTSESARDAMGLGLYRTEEWGTFGLDTGAITVPGALS